MYSYKFVKAPTACAAGCGTIVTSRLAGHYYVDPMCDPCFRQAAPELARALSQLQPLTDLRYLEVGTARFCCNCGSRLSGRITGYHLGDPMCIGCFRHHDPNLAVLLRLEEAVLEAAKSRRYAEDLFAVAVWYSRALDRLDARSQAPLKPAAALIRLPGKSS